jgi:hypothetical protein
MEAHTAASAVDPVAGRRHSSADGRADAEDGAPQLSKKQLKRLRQKERRQREQEAREAASAAISREDQYDLRVSDGHPCGSSLPVLPPVPANIVPAPANVVISISDALEELPPASTEVCEEPLPSPVEEVEGDLHEDCEEPQVETAPPDDPPVKT